MRIGKHLNLDVTAVVNQALQHQCAVAKRALRFTARAFNSLLQLGTGAHQTHAAPAAPGNRLDQERIAQFLCLGHQSGIALIRPQIAGRTGHTRVEHAALGQGFVAHGCDGAGRRADEDHTRVLTSLGKGGVFTQKAIAGVQRICTGLARGFQNGVNAQIRF